MGSMKNRSSSSEHEMSTDEDYLKNYARNMLKGKIFIGTFVEKRLVNRINAYRDVVQISPAETNLIRDVEIVKKRLKEAGKERWIGITSPVEVGVGHSLWVELEEEVFGTYWYKIKAIQFRHNEILMQLKQVQPISSETTQETNKTETEFNIKNVKLQEELVKIVNSTFTEISKVVTFSNVKDAIVFLFVLVVTVLTSTIEVIKFLSEYSIKFMKELSNIIKAMTPFMLGVVGMFEKIVGGFYLLIAMIWKDSRAPPPQYVPMNKMLTYESQFEPRYGVGGRN